MSERVESEQSMGASARSGLRRLLASTAVSILGQGMVLAAVPLLAARLTDDPFQVSLTVAASYAAWLLVGLPAGALVDRWPRRSTMVWADIIRAVVIAVLGGLVYLGSANIWMLIAAVFIISAASCLFDPAAQAAIPQVVGRDQAILDDANSKIWSLDLIGRSLLGPPIGAVLFVWTVASPFLLNGLTFLVSAVLLVGLGRLRTPAPENGHQGVWASATEGLVFIRSHRELRALVLGMAAFNFVYNIAFSTFVLYALEDLHVTEQGYGFVLAAMATGGLAAASVVPKARLTLTPKAIYATGLGVQSAVWLGIWFVENGWLAAPLLGLLGAASMAVTILGATARQRLTPDSMLGRVGATTRVVGIGIASFGALIGGRLAGEAPSAAPLVASIVSFALLALFVAVPPCAGSDPLRTSR